MAMTVAAHALVIRPPADLIQKQPELKRQATDLALRYAHRELVTEDRLRAMKECRRARDTFWDIHVPK
jgi:hypothetical protein